MQQVPKKLDTITGEITKLKVYPKFMLENISNDVSKSAKKLKFKKRERVIFGLIRDDSSNKITILNEAPKEQPGSKKDSRRKKKESSFNTGRWHPEEHQRFIEALLKYGNDWKSVQRYVGSRSSTQARSHAQKFFVKIGKTQIENLQLDFENNSLKSLNIMANNLNNDQMARAIKSLNELAFDKKNSGRKNGKSIKLESPFGKYDTLNFENSNSEDDGSLFFSSHCLHNQEKMISQYSTSGEGNSAGFKMTKRKRLRTLKKNNKESNLINTCKVIGAINKNNYTYGSRPRSRAYSLRESPFLPAMNSLKENLTLNHSVSQPNQLDIGENLGNFTRIFKPAFNSVLCSNRKSSIDFTYPNFINDNTLFITNSSFRHCIKSEEKEFQLVFENSFKFGEENLGNEKVNYDNFDHEFSAILFLDENCSSQRKSSSESLSNSKSDMIDVDNIIDQFME